MANISDASGTVNITAPTIRDAVAIIEIFNKSLEAGDYYTIISKDYEFLGNDDNGNCEISCSFCGCGRWAFACNIEYSARWVNTELKRKKKEEDVQYLESKNWKMIYDFTDYEPGCGVFGQGTAGISHEAGQKLEKSKYIDGDWSKLPFTYYRIMDTMGWSIDEILDERYATSVLSGENDVEEYKDDLLEFLHDYAAYRCMSEEEARKEMCFKSEDFAQLLGMIDKRKQEKESYV